MALEGAAPTPKRGSPEGEGAPEGAAPEGGAPAGAAPEIFTVGHSNLEAGAFVSLLRAYRIETVADVRRFPGSRRHPHFGREALSDTLSRAGIGYVHMPALGGRRGAPAPDSPNRAWRVEAFRAYADAMGTREWMDALAALESLARERRVAIMCAEAVPWRCHRRLISDALVVRGWRVRHIFSEARADPHELHEAARVLPDGRLIYPLPEDEQGKLL